MRIYIATLRTILYTSLSLSLFTSGCFDSKTSSDQRPLLDSLLVIKQAPVVTGKNFDGANFSSESLRGSIWLASFMFTRCQGVCPVMNTHLMDIQNEYASTADVKFVSMSVEPTFDSESVLADYAKRYKAIVGKWYMISAPLDSIRMFSRDGFLLSDPVEPAAHSSRIVLVDRQGGIRGYYDSLDSLKVTELRRDITRLISEK